MITLRGFYLLLAFACHELIVAALYFEHAMGLEPCPLCMFQRLFVIGVGIPFLVAAIHNPGRIFTWVYNGLAGLSALLGLLVAARHAWLQSLPPDQVPDCGPGLDFIMSAFPLTEALSIILEGSGECAEVSWDFLGLSMPAWMVVVFSGFLLCAVFNVLWYHRWQQRRG